MKRSVLTRDAVVLVPLMILLLGIATLSGQQETGAVADPAEGEEGVEVLARGPLHEAFAEQVNQDPQAGIVVSKAPPEPISEEPPEYKPEEGNVIWIPGYWGWDDEREDYIWISGVWRNPPQGHRWVPGYWHEDADRFQWVSGFWQTTAQRQVEYGEQPPESLELGPSTAAPTKNHFWVPGCWVYRARWLWRPGYWRRFRANSTWVPDHYVATPRGAIFVGGYWDHRFSLRGQLYAPVYFSPAVVARPVFVYRPYCVVNLDAVRLHMFVRPRYSHYYFGDFYDPLYRGRHIYSNLYFQTRMFGYDPILTYNRCHYSRFGINYFNHLHHWHSYYGLHPLHRPGRTFGAQVSFAAGGYGSFLNVSIFVHSVRDVARPGHSHHQSVVAVGNNQRKDLLDGSNRVRELAKQRQLTEREVRPGTAGSTPGQLASARTGSLKLPEYRPVPGSRSVPGASPRAPRNQPADILRLPPGAKTPSLVVNDPGSGKPSISPASVPASIRTQPELSRPSGDLEKPGSVVGTGSNRPTRPGTKSPGTNLPRPPARTTVNSKSPVTAPTVPGSRPSSSSTRPGSRPSTTTPGARPSSSSVRNRPAPPVPGARPSVSSTRPSSRPSITTPGARPSGSSIRPSSRPSTPSPGARPSGSSIRPSSRPSITTPGARPSGSSFRPSSRPSTPSPGARPSGSSIRPSSRPSTPSPGARP